VELETSTSSRLESRYAGGESEPADNARGGRGGRPGPGRGVPRGGEPSLVMCFSMS